jgi:glycosyltransferase involved in cell wall biosynthesis
MTTIFKDINRKEKVSIIIPVYNSEKFLEQTIISINNQTWNNLEIIVVDDGSTDGSIKVIKKHNTRKLKIIQQENKGASAARNTALGHATGEYIQFLDSDDLLDKHKIEYQLKKLRDRSKYSIASGPFINFIEEPQDLKYPLIDNGYSDFKRPLNWLVESGWGKAMFPPVVWLVSKELIQLAGEWDETLSYNDDTEFFTRVILKSDEIVFCEDAISYYRRGNPKSLGSRADYKSRRSELDSLNLVTKHLLEHENSERTRIVSAYQYNKLQYSLYPQYKDLRDEINVKLKELGINVNFKFGAGRTSKLGSFIGWKTAKWIRYQFFKVF